MTRRRFRRDLLPGGRGDKLQYRDVDPRQLACGCLVEREHTRSRKYACEIALDHLSEDRKYYTKLATIDRDAKKLCRRIFRAGS